MPVALLDCLQKWEKEFESKNPGVDVQREAGGSTKLARMISEVGKPADIMASADYAVIDKTLIPKEASWNVIVPINWFATLKRASSPTL